ncbi:hypothetical protein [Microbulbifer sp. JMSA008]|uniref:hypothetical protein n=1 Tax=Microbulbifer sp. JMSA008 TaxID=3243373 RepID=UPI004039172D
MDEKYQVQLIKESSLFDADWYLSQHSDVEAVKLSPEQHYLRYGWRMGRGPSELFCGDSYLERYPDVKQSKVNPLVHYLLFGRREGRVIKPVKNKNINISKKIFFETLLSYDVDDVKVTNTIVKQLDETQRLLEKYVRRCHEFEYQIMDKKG